MAALETAAICTGTSTSTYSDTRNLMHGRPVSGRYCIQKDEERNDQALD